MTPVVSQSKSTLAKALLLLLYSIFKHAYMKRRQTLNCTLLKQESFNKNKAFQAKQDCTPYTCNTQLGKIASAETKSVLERMTWC